MNVIKRKNTQPTQFGRSSNGEGKFHFMLQIKLALVLLFAGLGYFAVSYTHLTLPTKRIV